MKRETNEQFVKRLMSFNPAGALCHVLILDAIQKQAKAIAEAEPIVHGMINGHAYKACAAHIVAEFAKRDAQG